MHVEDYISVSLIHFHIQIEAGARVCVAGNLVSDGVVTPLSQIGLRETNRIECCLDCLPLQ